MPYGVTAAPGNGTTGVLGAAAAAELAKTGVVAAKTLGLGALAIASIGAVLLRRGRGAEVRAGRSLAEAPIEG